MHAHALVVAVLSVALTGTCRAVAADPVADAPLRAAQAGFDVWDRAAELLRADDHPAAARWLRESAVRLPAPYRYDAEYLAELTVETAAAPPAGDLPRRESFHRRRADLFGSLGDYRSAADELWRVAEIDPQRFARSKYDIDLLRRYLVRVESSVDELRRLVKLASLGPAGREFYHDRTSRYETSLLQEDSRLIARLRGADEAARVAILLEERHLEAYEYGGPAYLLRTLMRSHAPDQRAVGDLLDLAGDVAGARAWQRLEVERMRKTGEIEPENNAPYAVLSQAITANSKGDFASAEKLARPFVDAGPDNAHFDGALYNLARSLQGLRRYEEAEEAYLRLIKHETARRKLQDPVFMKYSGHRSLAARLLSECYAARGKFDLAIEWLARERVEYQLDQVQSICGVGQEAFHTPLAEYYLLRNRSESDLAAAWTATIEGRTDIRRLGPLLVEQYRRRNLVGQLREDLKRRIAEPRPSAAADVDLLRKSLHAEGISLYTDPVKYRRLFSVESKVDDDERKMRLEVIDRLTTLVEWRTSGDVEKLWLSVVATTHRPLELVMYGEFPVDSLWHVRHAVSLFLEQPTVATKFLEGISPRNEQEAYWHLFLQACLNRPEVGRKIESILTETAPRIEGVQGGREYDVAKDRIQETACAARCLDDDERGRLLARTKRVRWLLKEVFSYDYLADVGDTKKVNLRFLD